MTGINLRLTAAIVALCLALGGGMAWCQTAAEPPAAEPGITAIGPATPRMVRAKFLRDPWQEFSTRLLTDLPDFHPPAQPVQLSRYGGWLAHRVKATGYFRTQKIGDRWWLVDPAGYLYLSMGVSSVSPGQSENARTAFTARFGTEARWANETTSLLNKYGFNGTGSWSKDTILAKATPRVPYTPILNFMSGYGKKRGGAKPGVGHTAYPQNTIFVFDPQFITFADELGKTLAANKHDPYLLGYFSDNELPFPDKLLDNYLSLDPSDPGYQAAEKWLWARKGTGLQPAQLTVNVLNGDREHFRAFVIERYFSIVSRAIKKYDPNHLFLGSRFYGDEKASAEALAAAGEYADVVSMNVYHEWTPPAQMLRDQSRWADRPLMVTEWYAKGNDSGMANSSGAGWTVDTQQDRGAFYQNFTLALLESRACVGWHWFMYLDNDPSNSKAEASNRDANKGILNIKYEPWQPLLDAMKPLNQSAYPLTAYFDHAALGQRK